MNNVKYPNFIVRTVNSDITLDNFYKQDYNVFSANNEYLFTLYRTFVDMYIAERLCSGNTEECIAAIKAYFENVEYHMNQIVESSIIQDK
nr:MAG TPA: hypothetical protein [Crassvirales sp.]